MSNENYRELQRLRPDLFERAVQIGHIVTLQFLYPSAEALRIAAQVEGACVEVLLRLVQESGDTGKWSEVMP